MKARGLAGVLFFLSSLLSAEPFDFDPLNQPFINEDLHLEDLREFGFTPENAGAKEGLEHIFGGKGFRLFVPEELFQKLIVGEAKPKFELRRQWIVYGNSPSPKSRKVGGTYANGRDAGLNYAVSNGYVSFTCFQCHAGMVAGRLVAGLGNAHIDQNALVHNLTTYGKIRDFYVNKIKGGLGEDLLSFVADLTDEKKEHLKYFALYSETILRPALKKAASRGDDYGPYPVWQLFARLKDPKKSGFEVHPIGAAAADLKAREALVQQAEYGPVDRRPWWLRKHDTKSYWYGDTLASPESGKDFAINFTVPHHGVNETYPKRSEEISTILKFALHTKAPAYPRKLNAKLVTEGAKIYEAKCARCHGQFVANDTGGPQEWILKYRSLKYAGAHPDWKGKALPEVLYGAGRRPVDPEWTEDTDLTYSRALQKWGAPGSLTSYAAGLGDFFAKNFGIPPEKLPAVYNPKHDGYRAPPLVGIWASAPYLHNGSVPTLQDLFEYPRKPVWVRVYDTSEEGSYDFENVGLGVEFPEDLKMPKAPVETFDHVRATNYRRFYDTSRPGYSSKGAKTCGPNLQTKAMKDAVIEFLKSLSDETVKPEGSEAQWGRPLL